MKRAPIFDRFAALVIDAGIIAFFSVAVFVVAFLGYGIGTDDITLRGLSVIFLISSSGGLLIFLFYFTYLTMDNGATIGKHIFKIRVIKRGAVGFDVQPGFTRALVRTAAYAASASVCFLGFIMAFFFRGRTFHDIVAGTQVVTVEEDL